MYGHFPKSPANLSGLKPLLASPQCGTVQSAACAYQKSISNNVIHVGLQKLG